jgi:hypothetical protein
MGLYSEYFIFFIAYKWTQKFVFVPGKPFQDSAISLLDPIVTYEENEVL